MGRSFEEGREDLGDRSVSFVRRSREGGVVDAEETY
jgi:hypothetical protein